MSAENDQTEQTQPPPSDSLDDGLIQPGPYEKFINWAARLPWWAIILVAVAVVVLYSMLSSAAYRKVIQRLTDDPHASTDNLYEVVQIVGEPTTVTGTLVSETHDSIISLIDEFLSSTIRNELRKNLGMRVLPNNTPASITVKTESDTLTIPKDQITTEERDGDNITLTYTNKVTVTGILTKQNDKTMTIRTVDEERVSFDSARILNRETTVVPCDKTADPNCQDQELTTIQRQGEILQGTLQSLSNTNMNIKLTNGSKRELRPAELEYLYVNTLTVAANASRVDTPVAPGDEVRIGYVDGTDITRALDQFKAADNIPVSLRYVEGEARVVLVSYPDLETALQATGTGDATGLLYLDSGPNRLAVQQWVTDHPEGGVVIPGDPYVCLKNCPVTAKLIDDEVTGRVIDDTGGKITLVTTEAQYQVINRKQILDNRRMKPGDCALNNLRGCDSGIFLTLGVTFQAYGLALVLGLIFGLLRVQTNPVLYAVSTLYVEVIRGIPLLVILLYAGFVVSPWLRDNTPLHLGDTQEAVIGLAFGYGAFVAEIFRAGIQSISRGQMEAARSLGMSYPQAMRYVVLPQAVRVVLPPLGNDFISMLKDSALISVLALPDLLQLGRLYVSRTYKAFEGYNSVAILYLLMTLFLSSMVRIIERRTRLPK
jgi:polar amino acid transport system permease protein